MNIIKYLPLLFSLLFTKFCVQQQPPLQVGVESMSSRPVGPPRPQSANSENPNGMDVKRLNKTRTVQSGDNWSVGDIPTTLLPGVPATIILPVGPVGVDTGGTSRFGGPWGQYQIRISDGAKSETVYVSGGTCVAGADNCKLIFRPYFSHSASTYTLGSATQGIQEAINDGCGLPNKAADWPTISGCHVVIPPRGKPYGGPKSYSDDYNIYGSIFLHTTQSKLSGDGIVINHYGRGPALVIGYLTPVNADGSVIAGFPATALSNLALDNTVEGISFRSPTDHSSEPAYAGSLITSVAYSSATHLNTVTTARPHGLRTGDMVTILFTDPPQFWGDVPSITVVDATTFTYYRDRKVDWPMQKTPGIVALAYEPVLDNATGTTFLGIKQSISWELGHFNSWFDFWDDERALVQAFDNAGASLNSNVNWTGSFFLSAGAYNLPSSRQQLAPVVSVTESNITANYSNGFSFFNSNGLYVRDTVIQAQGLWQANVSNITGNYQGATFENIYTETGPNLNPLAPLRSPWPGMGNAGLIAGPSSGAARYTIKGAAMGGSLPTYGTGTTQYVYSVVINDLTTGTHSSPLPVMLGRTQGSDTITVRWPRVANGRDTITYHIIRNVAPVGISAAAGHYVAPTHTNCRGGTVNTCGTIAVNVTQCAGLTCSVTDDVTLPTSRIADDLRPQNYIGNISFWPAVGVITSGVPIVSDFEISTIGIGAQANAGSVVPVNYAIRCLGSINVFGGYSACEGSVGTTNGITSAVMLNDFNHNKSYIKGRVNLMDRVGPQELITLSDADSSETVATTGYRPEANALDAYVGLDGPKEGFSPNAAQVALGSPISISSYIGSTPDNSAWKERLTLNSKELKVPVEFHSGINYEFSGPELSKPSNPAAGFQRIYLKTGSGLCAIDSLGTERCTQSNAWDREKSDINAGNAEVPWFTTLHMDEKALMFPDSPQKAALFGVILTFPMITKSITYKVGIEDSSETKYDIGIYSGPSNGRCVLVAHTGAKPGRTAMTLGYHTVNWQEGTASLRPGRYYLAVAAGSARSLASLGADSHQLTFSGGNSADTVGNVTVTQSGKLDTVLRCPLDEYKTAIVPAFIIH